MLAATAAVLPLTSSAFLACTSWVRRIRARFCYRTTTRGTNQRKAPEGRVYRLLVKMWSWNALQLLFTMAAGAYKVHSSRVGED